MQVHAASQIRIVMIHAVIIRFIIVDDMLQKCLSELSTCNQKGHF